MSEPRDKDPGLAATAALVGNGPGPAAGSRVGEYVIERELGRGGMGAVFAAYQPVIGKRVAIKVLDAYFSRDMGLVRRFLDEARAVNKIGHPNIIDVFSFGQLPDGRQYFVMEFLEGETMADWLARGRPDFNEARRLMLQVCEALEAAHREGIIHRDIKPENLWIARPKHGESFMKVLDFGIAKLVASEDAVNVTKTGTVMGTPQFMSPEQCTGRGVDHRTDIYALGVILFRIYTGRLPFEGESVAEILAAQLTQQPPRPGTLGPIPAPLENLILSALDKKPEGRPATAAELGARLREVAQIGGSVTAVHAPAQRTGDAKAETRKGFAIEEEEGRGRTARPGRVWMVVGGMLVVGGIVAWLALRGARPSESTPPPTASSPRPAPAKTEAPAVVVPAPAPAPAGEPKAQPAIAPETAVAAKRRTRSGSSRAAAVGSRKAAPGEAAAKPKQSEPVKGKASRAARRGLIQENPF